MTRGTMRPMYFTLILLAAGIWLYSSCTTHQIEHKSEWKYVTKSEDDNEVWETYYQTNTIKRKPDSRVEVWLKQVPIAETTEEKQRIIQSTIKNRELNKMPTQGYDKFAYSLMLVEIDCSSKAGRNVSIKDFDETGKLLGADTIEGVPFA